MDAVEQQCDLVIQKFEEKINELKEIDVVNEVGIRNIKAFQE